MSFNRKNKPFSGTIVNLVPLSTMKILISNHTQLFSSGLTLPPLTTCNGRAASLDNNLCSVIRVEDASLIGYNRTIVGNTVTYSDVVGGLNADIVYFNRSKFIVDDDVKAFVSASTFFFLSSHSSITYSGFVGINSTYNVSLLGPVHTSATAYNDPSDRPTIKVKAEHLVVLQDVAADYIFVHSEYIHLPYYSHLRSFNSNPNSCYYNHNLSTNSIASVACNQFNVPAVLNTAVVLHANSILSTFSHADIWSSSVFLCARNLTISQHSFVRTDGLGCAANRGPGSGGGSIGGSGGGGYGGNGGKGAGTSGGKSYSVSGYLYSGSGGGCAEGGSGCSRPLTASGGGIIAIEAYSKLELYGNVTSNGAPGNVTTAGGGSGGAVSIYAVAFGGRGVVSANGGSGGISLSAPGGGGGGGFVYINNSKNTDGIYNTYTFQGPIIALGGMAGGSLASSGLQGFIQLPDCAAGYGNDPSTGAICTKCPEGYYNSGVDDGPCLKCSNAPVHSYYFASGWTTKNCPYDCDPGYTTDNCYNQFQKFIYSTLGLGGVAGVAVGILTLILAPLIYYRLKRSYGWGDSKNKEGGDFFKRVIFFDIGFGGDDANTKAQRQHRHDDGRFHDTENPMFSGKNMLAEDVTKNYIRTLVAKPGDEMRREHRMADPDMIFHACRIYLDGSNHPSYYCGKSRSL